MMTLPAKDANGVTNSSLAQAIILCRRGFLQARKRSECFTPQLSSSHVEKFIPVQKRQAVVRQRLRLLSPQPRLPGQELDRGRQFGGPRRAAEGQFERPAHQRFRRGVLPLRQQAAGEGPALLLREGAIEQDERLRGERADAAAGA